MEHPVRREDSALVAALFAALDLACDHSDVEIIGRLTVLLERLAARDNPPPASQGGTVAQRRRAEG